MLKSVSDLLRPSGNPSKQLFSVLLIHFNTMSSNINGFTLSRITFLPTYYTRNENLWVDGFLFDFLQKKSVDAWVRQYVIYTGFLFSERLVFEAVIRIYLDLLVWPLHASSISETSNVSSMINITVFLYFTFFILITILFTLLF